MDFFSIILLSTNILHKHIYYISNSIGSPERCHYTNQNNQHTKPTFEGNQPSYIDDLMDIFLKYIHLPHLIDHDCQPLLLWVDSLDLTHTASPTP